MGYDNLWITISNRMGWYYDNKKQIQAIII